MSSRRLVFNTFANISAQGVATLVALVSLPLMLEAFGRGVYGVFVLASSMVGLVTLFDFGVGMTTIKLVASHLEADEPEELARTVGSAALLFGVLGIGAALALFVTGLFAETVFNVDPVQAQLLRQMLWIHAAAQVVIWPAGIARQVLAGHERYPTIVMVTVAVVLGNALAIVAVLLLDEGPLLLTAIQAALTTAGSVVLATIALRVLPVRPKWSRVDRITLTYMLRHGLPIFTVQIAAFMMRQQTDRIVLGIFAGAVALAVYEAAAKLGSLVAQMNDLTTSAMLPYMTRREVGGRADVGEAFLAGTRYTGLMLMPVIAALAAIAPDLVTIWVGPQLGSEVGATIVAARLLILSQVGLVLYSVADPILIGKGRYARWTPYAVALAGLNFALSVLLVRFFGVIGVAAGTLVACMVEAPLYLRIVSEEISVPVASWARRTVLPSLAVGSGAVIFVEVARALLDLASIWQVGAVTAGAIAVAWAVVFIGVLSQEERRMVSHLIGMPRKS